VTHITSQSTARCRIWSIIDFDSRQSTFGPAFDVESRSRFSGFGIRSSTLDPVADQTLGLGSSWTLIGDVPRRRLGAPATYRVDGNQIMKTAVEL
jgi:hypothetical protein